MQQFTRPLIMLTFALSSLTVSHAAFSITDQGSSGTNGQHSPIGHWEQFSTTLTASSVDTPSPEEETTITGPTFKWEGGNSTVHLTSLTGQTTGLENTSGTELTPGPNTINVKCTATFTRTKNGNTLSPITVPATLSVTFFIRKPVSLKSLDAYPNIGSNPSHSYADEGYPGRYEFRQSSNYTFAVLDNQSTAHYYGLGEVQEDFSPITADDPGYKAAIENQGAPVRIQVVSATSLFKVKTVIPCSIFRFTPESQRNGLI